MKEMDNIAQKYRKHCGDEAIANESVLNMSFN